MKFQNLFLRRSLSITGDSQKLTKEEGHKKTPRCSAGLPSLKDDDTTTNYLTKVRQMLAEKWEKSTNNPSDEFEDPNSELEVARKLCFSPEEKVLWEFNRRYAIVRTSTTYILVEKSKTNFELDSRRSFTLFHENDFFTNSNGETKGKAAFWLKHPKRRTFENIVFDPTRPGNYDKKFNIFKGFSIKPEKGECGLYWKHVKEVICSNNTEHYQYVRKWMASVIQKPHLLATALVLRGLQGTGKNKFVEHFGSIFDPYFLSLTNLEHLTGKFNNHLKYAYLIHANEAIWGGTKKEVGALKALITDPTIIIEGKGKDAIPVDNCRHLIVSSNEDWAVPMDLDDRRFFVLDISSHRKEDISYFCEIDHQMKEGGDKALLYDLLDEDLSGFDPRKMPSNDFGFDMKMKAASSVEKYVFESLKEGRFNLVIGSQNGTWGPLRAQVMHQYYREWCKEEGLSYETSAEFGKRLKKTLQVKKIRRSINDFREWWYDFLPLEESRSIFERFTKQTSRIWEE